MEAATAVLSGWLSSATTRKSQTKHALRACMQGLAAWLAGWPALASCPPHPEHENILWVGPSFFHLFFFPLPPERVRTTPNLYVLNGQRRELLREEGTEDKL